MTGLTPQLLLHAYALGVFPMAESRDDPDLFFVEPQQRGILPLDGFHVPRRLRRTIRSPLVEVVCNRAFDEVVSACAAPRPSSSESWINRQIRELYGELHRMGHAHSVECWEGARLVGGLYGVALGAAFFGESMFSRARDASKIALVHLVARLRRDGFVLLDTQFVTDHLRQFGAYEMPREAYRARLADAIQKKARFAPDEPVQESLLDSVLGAPPPQATTQTS